MSAKLKSLIKTNSFRLSILLIAIVAVFHISYGRGDNNTAAADSSSDSTAAAENASPAENQEPARGVPVEVSCVQRGDVHDYILQNTTVDTEEGVEVYSRLVGVVRKLCVEEGDRVAQGSLFCLLEDDDYRLARDKSKVNYDKLGADFHRLQDMHDKQLTSTKEFEEARFNLEQARIDWETAELNLRRTRITAPIAGVVTRRHIRLGEQVTLSSPLFEIVNMQEKIVVIHLPEQEISRVKVGQKAFLSTKNLPDGRFEAVVKRLSPTVDAENGTFKVTVRLSDPENLLRPGMFVSVQLVTETHRNALLIPKTALVYDNGTPFAFFVEEDTLAHRVRIQKGFSNERYVEVLSSISDTDRVVVVGQNGLKDRQRVKVVAGLLEERAQIGDRRETEQDKI